MRGRLVPLSVLLALSLAGAACGQKSDVAEDAAGERSGKGSPATTVPNPTTPSPTSIGGSGASTDTPETTTPASGGSTPTTAKKASGSSGRSAPTTRGSGGTAGSGGATTGGSPSGGGAAVPAGPLDRTGVSDREIVIGIHAPVTGAAPVPQDSFDKGKDVYWDFLKAKGGIFGRNVRVVFRDDRFDPSHARTVCREMVEQEKVFLLIGAAGSEQITACARYAAEAGVPYLSAGVNEDGLAGLSSYFALSMTYRQQSPLLAQVVKNRLKRKKVAIVVNDTPSLDETWESIQEAARAAQLEIVYKSRVNKNAQPGDPALLTVARDLSSSGAEAVIILTSPVVFLQLVRNTLPTFRPFYVGPGVSNGLNLVAEIGCATAPEKFDGKAQFLSPFVQLDVIDRYDADYRKAYRAKNPGDEPDDLGLANWALSKGMAAMLEAGGADLSRQSFLAGVLSGREFATNIFPAVRYSGSARFGASQAHLLVADCASRSFKTAAAFASGF